MPLRTAKVPAFAKVNLDLRVLHKRPDSFHELRTIFQTITLADSLEIEYERARETQITLRSAVDIPNNLVLRAAQAVFDATQATGRVTFHLRKEIPMGGGLGGGSTDAAAVVLALPVLLGKQIPLEELMALGAALGSDVPFFLLGGCALGLGRGTELYPLPDIPARPGLVIAPEVHVSTPDAYRALGRGLTLEADLPIINSFQSLAWSVGDGLSGEVRTAFQNDFEEVVFRQHPPLQSIKKKLQRLGARPAMMTGSGAALFGLFADKAQRDRAQEQFGKVKAIPVSVLSRRQYRKVWWKSLRDHMDNQVWPPQSRYVR